jgi:hypothetical protein
VARGDVDDRLRERQLADQRTFTAHIATLSPHVGGT